MRKQVSACDRRQGAGAKSCHSSCLHSKRNMAGQKCNKLTGTSGKHAGHRSTIYLLSIAQGMHDVDVIVPSARLPVSCQVSGRMDGM